MIIGKEMVENGVAAFVSLSSDDHGQNALITPGPDAVALSLLPTGTRMRAGGEVFNDV